jgi:hypothetical protein
VPMERLYSEGSQATIHSFRSAGELIAAVDIIAVYVIWKRLQDAVELYSVHCTHCDTHGLNGLIRWAARISASDDIGKLAVITRVPREDLITVLRTE